MHRCFLSIHVEPTLYTMDVDVIIRMCLALLPHQKKPGGGTGLVTDDPNMRQIVLHYMVPVTLAE